MNNNSVVRFDLASAVSCLALIAIGLAAMYWANNFSTLGAVFPLVVSGLMVALSCLYLVMTWLRPTARRTHEAGSGIRRFGVMVVMLAWAFLLEPLGFLVSGIVAFAALLVVAHFDRWTARIVLLYGLAGVVVLGTLYSVFKFALQVPLPTGWLF